MRKLKESIVYRSDVKTILDKAKKLKCHKGLIEDLTAIYGYQPYSDDWEIIDICEGYGEEELLNFVKELLGSKENKSLKESKINPNEIILQFNDDGDCIGFDFESLRNCLENYGFDSLGMLENAMKKLNRFVKDLNILDYLS